MLRNAKGTISHGNVALERVLSSSNSRYFFLKSFSTWLDARHLPQNARTPLSTSTLESHSTPSSSRLPPASRRFASTRHSPRSNTARDSELAQLPRFLRRQQLQGRPATKTISPGHPGKQNTESKPSPLKAPSSTYRSRHYDASNETPKSEVRLLEPHVLSSRLKKLCEAGKVDDAVFMLKNAPLDAQNTPVWNTLIWESLKAKRYQLAYQLFVDMKRRGFSPTIRTFQTFFSGLSRIEQWSTHPKQLANARSLYESFQRHISSVKRIDPQDAELSVDPLAGYIRILGNAGEYQEIFDVYYAMDQDGPMAPNQYIFTAMFQAIAAAKSDTVEGSVKVAADARLLWNQLVRAAKKNPSLAPDSHTVVSAMLALSGGNQMDHDLAFKIVAQYYGLEVGKTISQSGILPLRPESFNAILKLCNRTKNYSVCTQFLQQVKRRPEEFGGVSIVDRVHMEEVLKADLALHEPGLAYHALDTLEWMLRQEITGENGPKIRPSLTTYNLVMQACWRGPDWNSATRTFDLMTGYHAHDFKDGAVAAVPRLDKRGPGRNLPPTTEIMSSMVRAAFATKNRADMRQALRIVDYLGFDELLRSRGDEQHETTKTVKHRALFGKKLASAIVDTVNYVLEEKGKYARAEESGKWRALARQAESKVWDSGTSKAVAGAKDNQSPSKGSRSAQPRKHRSTS
ncbi:hypothetical protein BDZ97DRAFT_1774343 [Flammula alnicola]|nr:hypothetical protein BDZ97DRAFT_1774343 [Flammula alnicola]